MEFRFSTRPFNIRISRKPPVRKPDRKPARSQTRESYESDISLFNAYSPLKHNIGIFSELREKMPFFNVAIKKLVQLIGDPVFEAENETVQTKIEDFARKVQVGNFGRGLGSWLDQLEDATFETGGGWGELVGTQSGTEVHHLKIARTADMVFLKDKSGELIVGTYRGNQFMPIPIENMDLIYYLTFDQRQGHPQGYSLLYSTIFASQVFIRWQKSFENQLIRFGDISLLGIFPVGEDMSTADVDGARDSFLTQLEELNKAKRKGQVGDIGITVPEKGFQVTTLGADAKYWETKDAVRTLLEQLIANTGLPPHTFGIHWSTSERMSEMQNDVLQSTVTARRARIDPIVERVIDTMLIMTGDAGAKWSHYWPDMLLLGEKEKAESRKANWEATYKMLESLAMMIEMEFASQESAEEMLHNEGIDVTKLPSNWLARCKEKKYIEMIAKEIS